MDGISINPIASSVGPAKSVGRKYPTIFLPLRSMTRCSEIAHDTFSGIARDYSLGVRARPTSYAASPPLHPYVEDNPIHSIGITAAKICSQHRLLLGLQLDGSLVKRIAVRVCSGRRSAIGYGRFILEKPTSAAARARRATGIGS